MWLSFINSYSSSSLQIIDLFVGCQIYNELSHPYYVFCSFVPSHNRFDPCKQLFEGEGFCDVIIRPRLEDLYLIFYLPSGGDYQNGYVFAFSYLFTYFYTIKPR
jgi:hypothetical protein